MAMRQGVRSVSGWRAVLLLTSIWMLTACSSTPQVGKVEAGKVEPGGLIHINGKNFGEDPARITVAIGKAEARVKKVEADSMEIEIPPELGAGKYQLVVTDNKTKMASAPVQIQVTETVRVPANTKLVVRIEQAIGSEINKPGDAVHLVLMEPLIVKGGVVAASGSEVIGRVTHVKESGRVKGRAAIGFTLEELKLPARSLALSTDDFYRVAPSTVKRDAATIGIATGVGALIGGLTGGGKGAAIGGAIGGGAGTGTVLLTKGKHVLIPVGGVFTFALQNALQFEITEPLPPPGKTS